MKPNVVFVDIGGVRASEALVRVLPAIVNACAPRVLSVKCEALALSAKENLNAGVKPTPTLKSDENPNPLPSNFWASVCTLEVTNARKRSVFKSISAEVPANANFSRYPLKLPQKFTVTSRLIAHVRRARRLKVKIQYPACRPPRRRCATRTTEPNTI